MSKMQFEMIFTADTKSAKAGTSELKKDVAALSEEAGRSAAALDKHTAALNRDAEAARKTAEAVRRHAEAERDAREQVARTVAGTRFQYESREQVEARLGLKPKTSHAPLAPAHQPPAVLPTSAPAMPPAAPPAGNDDVRARYVPLYKAQRDYTRELENVKQAEHSGILSADESAAAMTRLKVAYDQQVESIKRTDPALRGLNDNYKLTAWEARNLSYQVNDVVQSLMLGMPIQQVILQQGPQIVQIYGGVANAFKALAAAITPTRVALGLSVSAIALGAKAWNDYLKSTKEVQTAASGLGRAVAGSTAEMEASANAGAAAVGISVSSARSMQAQFLRTGRIGAENFEALIGISKDFAATIGISADQAGKALADMFADPAKAADELFRKYGLIDAATARQATNLAAQNRQSEAQALLIAALPGRLASAAEATTALGRAWGIVARSANDAYDWIGRSLDRMVSGPTLEERIAEMQATRDRLNQKPSSLLGILSPWGSIQTAESLDLEKLQEEKRQKDAAAAEEKRVAEEIARSRAALAAAETSPANADFLRRQSLENSLAAMRSGVDKDSKDATGQQMLNTAIAAQERVLDALINKRARAIELDRLEIQIANERNPLLRAELESRRAVLQLSEQEVSAAEIATEAARARTRVIEQTIGMSARQADEMREEVEIRNRLTAQVAAGAITSADANRLLQEELQLRPLIAAAAMAEGAEKERLNQVISDLKAGYTALAAEEKRASAVDFLRGQSERLEQLRAEKALIGENETVRARVLALLEAEQEIRRRGLEANGEEANAIRRMLTDNAMLSREIEKQAEAWGKVQSAGESAIDGIVDRIASGDLKGAVEAFAKELASLSLDIGVKAPLKNALLGTDYGTISDIGGLKGIVARLFGGGRDEGSIVSQALGQTVGAMNVTAATVVINGGIGAGLSGLIGANDNSNVIPFPGSGAAATNQSGAAAQVWNFFAGKGLKDFQIAGIMGNVQAESAFNPLAVGDGGAALGLFQHNDRAPSLLNHIGGRQNLSDVAGQLDFAWKELLTTENRAFQNLLKSTNVREATAAFGGFERPQGFSWSNPESMHNWAGRLSGAEKALTQFGSTTSAATQNLGSFGDGLGQFGNALSNVNLGGGGAGGGLGGLLGGFNWGSLFSPSWKPNTTFGAFLGLGYSDGGWTGPGARMEPAGVVHADEYVFSKPAVQKIGVAKLDAMHNAAKRGYADGGFAAPRAFYPSAAGAGFAPASQNGFGGVTVNNYSSSSVQAEETTDERGQRQVNIEVADRVGAAMAQPGGGAKRHLERTYGLKPRGVRR